jgi:hypothetical protein
MVYVGSKRCSKCRLVKSQTEFSSNRNNKDGLQRWCKACNAEHYTVNREAIAAQQAHYRAANKEVIRVKTAAARAARRRRQGSDNRPAVAGRTAH